MNPSVESYIQATRLHIPDAANADAYAHFHFRFLMPLLLTDSSLTKPTVVFSSSRKCELVGIEGENYFIYDQYFGKTLSEITRHLTDSKREHEIYIFLNKLIAERLRLIGRNTEALMVATVYDATKSEVEVPPTASARRAAITAFQELYVMAHEVYHDILSKNDIMRAEVLSGVVAFLKDHSEHIGSMLADEDLYKLVWREASESDREESDVWSKAATLIAALNKISIGTKLEMCCDYLATNYLANVTANGNIAAREPEFTVANAVYAAHLTHQVTKYLSIIDAAIYRYDSGLSDNDLWIAEIGFGDQQMRGVFNCAHCCQLLGGVPPPFGLDPSRKRAKWTADEAFSDLADVVHKRFGNLCWNIAADIARAEFFRSMPDIVKARASSFDSVAAGEMTDLMTGWTKDV